MTENLYDLIDSMLAVSYLVQDVSIIDHWDRVIGVGKLNDPDFLKTLPRKLSELMQWFKSNEKVLTQVHDMMFNVSPKKKGVIPDEVEKITTTKILDLLDIASKKQTREEMLEDINDIKQVYESMRKNRRSSITNFSTLLTEEENLEHTNFLDTLNSAEMKDTKEEVLEIIEDLKLSYDVRVTHTEKLIKSAAKNDFLSSFNYARQSIYNSTKKGTTEEAMLEIAKLAPETNKFDPHFGSAALKVLIDQDKGGMVVAASPGEDGEGGIEVTHSDSNDATTISSNSSEGDKDDNNHIGPPTANVQDWEEPSLLFIDDAHAFEDLDSEAVWSIAKNPRLKRITVVFRGSMNKKDWLQDAKAFDKKVTLDLIIDAADLTMPTADVLGGTSLSFDDDDDDYGKTPEQESEYYEGTEETGNEEAVRSSGMSDKSTRSMPSPASQGCSQESIPYPDGKVFNDFDEVIIHQGFFEYLLDINHNKSSQEFTSTDSDSFVGRPRTKLAEILNRVNTIMKELPDYSLYFTGHSLGAALATITAFAMAVINPVKVQPIGLITFASPHVGKECFVNTFKKLERANRLQHLRITNFDDLVPMALYGLSFKHTGIHLNFRDPQWFDRKKDMYELDRLPGTMRPDPGKWAAGNPTHEMQAYKERLDKCKEALQKETFDDVCKRLRPEEDLSPPQLEQTSKESKSLRKSVKHMFKSKKKDKHVVFDSIPRDSIPRGLSQGEMLIANCTVEDCRVTYRLQSSHRPSLTNLPPGSVIIRTIATSICGSDLCGLGGHDSWRRPINHLKRVESCSGGTGHEVIGEIVDLCSPCKYQAGQRVLAMSPAYIQRVDSVRSVFEEATGFAATSLPDQGSFAQYFVSHDCACLPVPVEAPYDGFDPLWFVVAQPIGTLIHACKKLGSVIGLDVAIVGQGQNGLLMTQILSNMGAKRIITLDLLESRLECSKKCKATHTINKSSASNEAIKEHIKDITNGKMCDITIDMVGHQGKTAGLCAQLTKDGGSVLLFGLPPSGEDVAGHNANGCGGFTIESEDFFRNIRYLCAHSPGMDCFELGIEFLQQGRVDPSPLITHYMTFDKFSEAYDMANEYKDNVVKIILTFEQDQVR